MINRTCFALIAICVIAGCSSNGGEKKNESSDRPEFADENHRAVRECRRPIATGGVRGAGSGGSGQAGGGIVSPVTDCDIDNAARSANTQVNAVNGKTNEQEQQAADTSQSRRDTGQEQFGHIDYPQPQMPMGGMRRF